MGTLIGNSLLYSYNISDKMAANLRSWLSYSFVETGGFTNIEFSLPTSGYTILQSVHDDRYSDGRVYEMFGPSLVYETDISPNDPTLPYPVICSGIYVNSTFYPTATTSGIYTHVVDFDKAKVIFASPVQAVVQAEYTIKDVAVYTADSKAWKTIVSEYGEQYINTGTNNPSGIAMILKEKRAWFPSVFVEIQERDNIPLQLGGGEYAEFNVFYHIFSDKPAINASITDIINDQEGLTLNLFDPNNIPLPLNNNGSIASGLSYKQLSNRQGPYFWRNAWIKKSEGRTYSDQYSLFRGEVRHQILIERYGSFNGTD